MKNRIIRFLFLGMALCMTSAVQADTIPQEVRKPLLWRIGMEVTPSYVPGTSGYLKGFNRANRKVDSSLSGALRCDFSFHPASREGQLFRGLYQGVGVDVRSFFAKEMFGTPASVYVYQGAPVARFSGRLWLGYEWRFGVAFGWKHYQEGRDEENACVGTPVTAHMGLGVKLHYAPSPRWRLSLGAEGAHFSNGNTTWPNAGINSIGMSVGVAYLLNPQDDASEDAPSHKEASLSLKAEADRPGWFYDILLYGAWRKQSFKTDYYDVEMCPGRFGVAGIQFAPMRKFNRWVAAGAALNLQYDESAGISDYWVEGTTGDDLKFYRPPFGKQLSAGLSAHAELTMPIFSVNAGLGYDFVSPQGNKRFFQSLTLKTFITRHLYLNVGYRLGDFKEPQNLMLGLGVRIF